MPELPEVETTRCGVEPLLTGRSVVAAVVREARLRWPVELPAELVGQRLVTVERRAKYLIFSFQTGHPLLHLGMSGSLRVVPRQSPYLKHDHVAIEFEDGRALRLNDPRRFGSVHWHRGSPETHRLLADLGMEPLDPAFDEADRIQGRGRT